METETSVYEILAALCLTSGRLFACPIEFHAGNRAIQLHSQIPALSHFDTGSPYIAHTTSMRGLQLLKPCPEASVAVVLHDYSAVSDHRLPRINGRPATLPLRELTDTGTRTDTLQSHDTVLVHSCSLRCWAALGQVCEDRFA